MRKLFILVQKHKTRPPQQITQTLKPHTRPETVKILGSSRKERTKVYLALASVIFIFMSYLKLREQK